METKGYRRKSDPEHAQLFASGGRVPPHDLDAEAAVLSALLLDPTTLDQVQEMLKPEHFYSPANRRIYEACIALAQEGSPIDTVMVAGWLKSRERLAEVGGVPYIAKIIDAVPSVANVESYAKIIREKWRVRSLILTCQRVAAEGYGDVGTVQNFIDGAEQSIYELARSVEGSSVSAIRDVIRSAFVKLEEAGKRGSMITGFPTGFAKLDEMTSGLHPTDLIIIAARPGMGKCLAADSEIVLTDGRVSTIEQIVKAQSASLLTLQGNARFGQASPSAFVDDGIKPTFRVHTRLGRTVETTLSHPFLTLRGWQSLAHLEVGTAVAVPRRLPVFGASRWRRSELVLLGAWLGTPRSKASTTRVSLALQHDIQRDEAVRAVASLGGLKIAAAARGDDSRLAPAALRASSPRDARRTSVARMAPVPRWQRFDVLADGSSHALSAWLGTLGLAGKAPAERFVPEGVFSLRRDDLATLLAHVFASGARVTARRDGRLQIALSTPSERFARQLAHLLLRFGVVATLARGRTCTLTVSRRSSLEAFCEEIGLLGEPAAQAQIMASVRAARPQEDDERVPAEAWAMLDRARGERSWTTLSAHAEIADVTAAAESRAPLSAECFEALTRATGDVRLVELATGDVTWDEIVSIEPMGDKQVYDLTVPGTHNFVANDVCVHNTSLVMNIAINVAAPVILEPEPGSNQGPVEQPGGAVAVFSLEMPREQIATRMVASEARVDVQKLRNARLSTEDWHNLTQSAAFLSQLPIWVDDSPGITVLDVRSKVRRIQAELERSSAAQGVQRKMGLVVIDYLQLMKGSDKAASREQEISEISRGLKHLAKELHVPVIALSQLNRSVETRSEKSKRPQISDLRESGAIEQDADMICFIYRDDYYNKDSQLKGIAEIIIAKQRNGPTGKALVRWDGACTRFIDLAPGEIPEGIDDE